MTLTSTWEELHNGCKELANQVLKDKRKIDCIYGIPRGGLIPAVILSHLLNKPLRHPGGLGDICLLIDDICDTGLTMKVHKSDTPNCITATLYKHRFSKFTPDYYYEEVGEWVLFPWETEESSKVDYIGNPDIKSVQEYIDSQ